MPEMIPVGNTVTPPNPTQSLGLLSGLLGVQQQKLALQTGQQGLQTATATAQQAGQQNQELQALAAFTKNAVNDPSYQNPDGTANVQKYQQGAMAVAPTYGQAYIGNATANFTNAVQNRGALLKLSNEQRETAGGYLAAEAANPNASVQSFQDMTKRMRGVSDDPGYQSAVDSLLMHAPNTTQMPTAQASGALRNFARQVAVQTGAPGAVLSAPTTSDYTTPSGAIGQRQTNVLSPTPTGPIGTQVRQGIGPTGPAVPGPQPSSQDWQDFGDYQAGLRNRVGAANDLIPRAQMADQALSQIKAGGGAQAYASFASKLQAIPGMPKSIVDAVSGGNLAAAQEAEKYLFQTTFAGLKQSMQGDPARVAEFQSAEQIFPSIGTDPRATKTVLNFMVQQGQRDYAEQQALAKSRTEGNFNPVTWQATYQQKLRAGQVPGVPASQVPSSATQEGAKGTSRSGKPMVWKGGRWEYQ